MSYLTLIFDQLRAHKGRSALLLLTVLIAFFVFGMLGTLYFSMNSGSDEVASMRLIMTNQAGMTTPLPMAYRQKIQAIAGVKEVGYATWLGSYYQDRRQAVLTFAVEPATWLRQHPDMALSEEDAARFLRQKNGLLVSEALARKFNWKVGDSIPLGSILYEPPAGEPSWRYQVSGIYVSKDSGGGRNYMITHYDYLNENRQFWRDTTGAFMVTAQPGVKIDELGSRIDAYFAQSEARTLSATDRAFHMDFFAQFGDILFLIKCVVGSAFASLLLIVSSTAALTIRQRTRDLAVLKVVGFHRRQIMALVLGEILLLTFAGGLLGLGGAALFNAALTGAIPEYLPDIVMPWPVVLQSLLIMMLLGLVAACLPVLLALRTRPVQAFSIEN
ncbi:ABC transporter permease [Chitinimonas sp.]|uniref:ABC transporter permease n=1 Tax=Chitinimonas sp. TaxID=1934313 RepID=UPI0035AFF50B